MRDPVDDGPQRFHSTAWSVIRAAGADDPTERLQGLERLARLYWRPVYWHVRRSWNLDPEDARDATQAYFSMLIEQELLTDLEASRGRFRAFLKVTLRNFMRDRRRRDQAFRRGGDRNIIPLDEMVSVEQQPPSPDMPPEVVFDRELLASIISTALVELKNQARAEGRERDEEIFRRFYLAEAEGAPVSYRQLSEEFDVGPHEVKNRLFEMRLRFRRTVIDLLRDGTSSDDEVLAEMREVFGR